ncbi:C-Myc-binding protein isoform X1 [Callithrix jacchus]
MSSAVPSPPVAVSGASYAVAAVTMAHYKAADSKREQFRRYLEKSGVLDTLTKGEPGLGEDTLCPHRAPWHCLVPQRAVAWEGGETVLVALYEEPEKPNSALDFLKHHLGAATPENPEIELLRLELAEMKEKYEAIIEENKKLKAKLAQYEPPQEEKRAE